MHDYKNPLWCHECNTASWICGSGFTDYTCAACKRIFSNANTCIPTYCKECAEKLKRCQQCGKKLRPKIYNPTTKNVLYMLKESNKIEEVWDRYSLVNAHRAWKYIIQFDRLNNDVIKETHNLLMVGQPIDKKYRGDFRDVPVSIGGDIKSQSKVVIDSLIRDYCNHVNEIIINESRNHDAIHCHLQFEGVHPFIDGNGRIGRILLNWQLVKLGCPLLIYTYAKRKTYYRLFPSYRAREMKDLIAYFGTTFSA